MKPPKKFPIWVTGDKRKIAVTKMESEHIWNTIQYLQSRWAECLEAEKREVMWEWLTVFHRELYDKRGENHADMEKRCAARAREYGRQKVRDRTRRTLQDYRRERDMANTY